MLEFQQSCSSNRSGRIKSAIVARHVFFIILTSSVLSGTSTVKPDWLWHHACCVLVHMLEPNTWERSNQLLASSLIEYKSNSFEREFSIDCLIMGLESLWTRSLQIPICRIEIILIIRPHTHLCCWDNETRTWKIEKYQCCEEHIMPQSRLPYKWKNRFRQNAIR